MIKKMFLFALAVEAFAFLLIPSQPGYSMDRAYRQIIDKHGIASDSMPIFPDLVYEYRVTELNNRTPIELSYNDVVRRYIDVYTIERREHLAKIIGRAEMYFPIFEEALDRYGLPLELKYLAIVESALEPTAVSSSGAVGLWQFKINTSKMFDLYVDSYVDERRDPYKSTEAACSYLQYLYRIFNDWQLALAAYNGGPGEVQKAIERSGGKTTFWEIQPFLPDQTKGYVPAFIAVNYAMNFYKEHQIKAIPSPFIYMTVDTVRINRKLDLENVSRVLDIPMDDLRMLNPMYKLDHIPQMQEPVNLVLPKNKTLAFLRNQEVIMNGKAKVKNYHQVKAEAGETNGRKKMIHVVEKGEYFHKIAILYNCTINDILAWNNLTSNELSVGQELVVWVDKELANQIDNERRKQQEQQNDKSDRFVYYTVQEGDTIWSIASKFNCNSISQLKKENNIVDETDLKPGTKLKIFLNK